ncbi:MAG: glycosyltransferase [Candidatus Dadabacteria bacterium]|nr:glycosyltransferase [Candidatus Dadabacteria bacterium]
MSSAPSIVLTLPNLRLGGAQRQTVAMANGLCRAGFKCAVFALGGGELGNETDGNVRVEVGGVFSFLRMLRRERPDILYSRHWTKILNTAAGKILGIKTVWTEGNSVEFLKKNRPASYFAHRLFARHADCFTAISRGLAAECGGYYGRGDVRVIYNGIDTELAKKRSTETQSHKWLADRTSPLVVSVGRLVRQKGFDTLIDAFAILRKTADARLLIVGDGGMRDGLKGRIKRLGLEDAVCLAGGRANPYPFIAAADIYAQPSVYEGFGNTLLEALSLGRPCVSTDYRFAANEIIEDGKSGLLVPVGGAQEMAGAILRLIQDPALAGRISAAARERAEHFSTGEMTENYSALFRDLVGEGK